LSNWHDFNGSVEYTDFKENRPQRITAAQAAHVVDIVCGIEEASREGRRVEITSEFPQPTPWRGPNSGSLLKEENYA
jgi:hypothetical protein